MGLRLAILKEIKVWGKEGGNEDLLLEYDENQVRSRLLARGRENLVKTESWIKHRWTKGEADKAYGDAFDDLIREFKESTIKLA